MKQGSFKIDKSKSVVIPEELHAFPRNVEFEAWLTLTGEATGNTLNP